MALYDFSGYTNDYNCTGTTGVEIRLNGSHDDGIYYVYKDDVYTGVAASGNGYDISIGFFNESGNYTIFGDEISGVTSGWTSTDIDIYWQPTATTQNLIIISGNTIGLESSEINVFYNLYKDGVLINTITGTNSAITFGIYTQDGTYTSRGYVVNSSATWTGVVTSYTYNCYTDMSGVTTIGITNYTNYTGYTTGRYFCTGETYEGVEIMLHSVNYVFPTGINFCIYNGNISGETQIITNSATTSTTFWVTDSGNYRIKANLDLVTGWTNTNIDVLWQTPPVAQSITGGGGVIYSGSTGFTIGLNSTETGKTYNLYRNDILINNTSGTGSAIAFGDYNQEGVYTSMGYIINSSATWSSGATTAFTYECYTNMTGDVEIIVYQQPTITTLPTTTIASLTAYANTQINVPVTYRIQQGTSVSEFSIILNYDYSVLEYVTASSVTSGVTVLQSRGVISFNYQSAIPITAYTGQIADLIFNYRIGNTVIRISDNSFYEFYNIERTHTLKQHGYITLSDASNGSVSGYKSISDGIGCVLYAPVGCSYDIYFDDVYEKTLVIYDAYRKIYKSNSRKITIRGNLNSLTKLDMSNNDLESFKIYATDLYRLNTLDLENNDLVSFDIPKYTNVFDLKNNDFSVSQVETLFKRCYESGKYNSRLDIRGNEYNNTSNQYYQLLILKGWTILMSD